MHEIYKQKLAKQKASAVKYERKRLAAIKYLDAFISKMPGSIAAQRPMVDLLREAEKVLKELVEDY